MLRLSTGSDDWRCWILSMALRTVEWSLPEKYWPISWREACVSSLIRKIAICLGTRISFFLLGPLSWDGGTEKASATAAAIVAGVSCAPADPRSAVT